MERADSYSTLHTALSEVGIEHSAKGGNGMFYLDGAEYSATFSISIPNAGLRQIESLIEDSELSGRIAVFEEDNSPQVTNVLKEIDQTVTVGPVDED